MNVLAVFAHPDDEVLGCGGTLAKHAEAGDNTAFWYGTNDRQADRTAARKALGFRASGISMLLPDQKFDTVPLLQITQWMGGWGYNPDVIYTHNPDDLNLDHAIIARAVLTAFRAPTAQATILACEVISSTEFGPDAFQPNHWEVLTKEHVDAKCRALDCYPTEVRDRPHPRNAEGIMVAARYRGQQICQPYAEAFRVLRSIR